MKHTRAHYFRLLVFCVLCLLAIITVLSFSNSFKIPGWSELFGFVSGKEEINPEEDYVRFLDVGQGDSILLSSNGYNALIDFGNQSDFGSELLNTLKAYDINRIDCAILSHYDTDHVGGGSKIIRAIDTRYALLPELDDRSNNSFGNFNSALQSAKTEICSAKLGTVVNIGDFEITLLAYNRDAKDSNDKSLVLMAEIDGVKFLFTGDAGIEVERQMLSDNINVDCDVYKAAHHGSRNSNSKEFILAASPKYAVISVGANNSYGHPHSEVIQNFEEANATIYRTDRSGDITFFVKDSSLSVTTEF